MAVRLQLDEDTLDLLLRTLVIADYLLFSSGRFRLTRLAARCMAAGAKTPMTGFAQWNYAQWEYVARLEDVVRTGRGVDFHQTLRDPGMWGHYQEAMLEAARLFAPIVARRVPVRRGAARLLDLGGSHGFVGAAICRRHPPMRSLVLDLPEALPHARTLAARAGIADIVEHRAGDVLAGDPGAGWDVILLSNLLHHFDAAQISGLLRRLHGATAAEGTVAIWDLERPLRGRRPAEGDGAALFFRLTSSAGTYHADEYAAWLKAAGFDRIRISRPRRSPGDVLVCARR
jgi:hypothetical protein